MQKIFIVLVMCYLWQPAFSQHEHHMPAKQDTTKPRSQMKMDSSMQHMQHGAGMNMQMDIPMSHAFSLNLPMNRNGSGTGWLPDASPMYGYMIHSNKWMYMVHGSIFIRYNDQDFTDKGTRGDSKFDAPSWFMLMGQRKVGQNGLFHFSTMLSLDPLIEGGKGYPLLFQTGESYKGQPLIDRQHPHDLFDELSVSYSHAFSKKLDAFIYVAYPGEPALGPVTFMHRPSALDNPNSPISHHWVDATHITFGVVTVGVRFDKFKLEGSSFTGREPNEERYGFDKPKFDSWSGRLSFNPSDNWALQVSHGYLKSPEELHPEENVYKTTASAIYSIDMGNENRINATVLWGMNKQKEHRGENAFMAEGAWWKNRLAVYTRYEFTEKSGAELVLEPVFESHDIFNIHALTLGANYDLIRLFKTRVAAGAQWSIYHAPESLDALYGKNPMSLEVYLRIYPSLMRMRSKM
ncbi:TonB-dependent receptor [Chitinophaga filiformis]|uniref:Uncharacterized protein n=1 Tax=Chitinophaga filiformis TaxID=104663 RepID=A0A1G7XPS7_CHIFI|nr:hypothetical protein [Chitinophaga filiformis]SDG86204.1 hypothetical protein SAMN04488121_10729 [Chitinophaga filiformis]